MRAVLPVILFFLLAVAYRGHIVRKILITGFAQGTTYHITYYATDSLVTQQQVDSLLTSIDSSLSLYKSYSLISRFNASGSGIQMDKHFETVLKKSLETCKATGGLFDITVQPLVKAWGFGATPADSLPDAATILSIKDCTGSSLLKVKGQQLLKKKSCVAIDMNGIAQGYSVDVLAAFLEKNNIENFIVELGGEIRVKGRRQPGGEKMKIGIESPATDELTGSLLQQVIEPGNGAITTSGSYRKYYESNGKRITHIIHPKTGYPVQNELISVTVIASDAITADAYDNALMLMGVKKGLRFIEKRKDLLAYFIYKDEQGNIKDTASRGFYKLLKK